MSAQELTPEAQKAFNNYFNMLCSKSKKMCALCERSFKRIEEENTKGRVSVMSAQLVHPNFKSKKYKICGDCYIYIMRSQ